GWEVGQLDAGVGAGRGRARAGHGWGPQRKGMAAARAGRLSQEARAGHGLYGALDLGTNNCRLLIATPSAAGFEVLDAFSRIVRLGEGLSLSGRLSDQAMKRTIEALRVCANKLTWRAVGRRRLVATEACRAAVNGEEFLH